MEEFSRSFFCLLNGAKQRATIAYLLVQVADTAIVGHRQLDIAPLHLAHGQCDRGALLPELRFDAHFVVDQLMAMTWATPPVSVLTMPGLAAGGSKPRAALTAAAKGLYNNGDMLLVVPLFFLFRSWVVSTFIFFLIRKVYS